MRLPGWLRATIAASWTVALLGCLHPSENSPVRPLVDPIPQAKPLIAPTVHVPQANYHLTVSQPTPSGPDIAPTVPVKPVHFQKEKAADQLTAPVTPGPALDAPNPATKPPPDPALVAALRAILKKEPAAESLAQLDPANQELVLSLLTLASRTGEGELAKCSPQEAEAWQRHLRVLGALLRFRAPLVLEKICFCRKIDGFGMYEALPTDPEFQPGSAGQPGDRIQVYVEVRNFVSTPRGSVFETNLSSTLEIRDFYGDLIHRMDFPAVADRSLTPRQDYFINYQFRVPAGLPAGRYTLWVTVQDPGQTSSPTRLARRSLDFRVNSGAPVR